MACFTACFSRRKAKPPTKYKITFEEEVSNIQNIRLYSYKELQTACGNFGTVNKIGMGGFGSVYKGKLKDGTMATLKVLSEKSTQGIEEFYTAASAGDLDFVKKLLEKDLLVVFGEGEYDVTDILYAAARSKSSEVFRLLIEFSGFWGPSSINGGEEERKGKEAPPVFKFEMTNRVVHATAKGGNLEVLKEFLKDCSDVLVYRDSQESTLLHTASGRGQIEIVKYLMSNYEDDIISSIDKHGNTALHVAAYRGYLAVRGLNFATVQKQLQLFFLHRGDHLFLVA